MRPVRQDPPEPHEVRARRRRQIHRKQIQVRFFLIKFSFLLDLIPGVYTVPYNLIFFPTPIISLNLDFLPHISVLPT